MIEPKHPKLSIGSQCRLLSIARSSFYSELQGESEVNLELMLLIDKQFLETPFYGVQQMTWHLQNEGYRVNVKWTCNGFAPVTCLIMPPWLRKRAG